MALQKRNFGLLKFGWCTGAPGAIPPHKKCPGEMTSTSGMYEGQVRYCYCPCHGREYIPPVEPVDDVEDGES